MKSVRKMVLVPYTEKKEKESRKCTLETDLIIAGMPKTLKKKAEALLRYLENEVSWKDNGEVVYKGNILPGSHITDLVRYSLQEYGDREPLQYQTFLEILKEINVPKCVVTQRKNAFKKKEEKKMWQKL